MLITSEATTTKSNKVKQVPFKNNELKYNDTLHTYTIDDIELLSMTRYIERFKKPFDSMNTAIGVKRSCNMKGTSSLNPNDLVHYWSLKGKRAASEGTAVHIFAQLYLLDRSTVPHNPKEVALKSYLNDIMVTHDIVGIEEKVYSKEHRLAGTLDLKVRDKKTKFVSIKDYKTSTDIFKERDKMLLEFKAFKHSKLLEYSIQLTMYDIIGNIDSADSELIILQDDGKYKIVPIIDVYKQCTEALSTRKKEIESLIT